MKTHELAKRLLKMPNKEITVSVDTSTCDENAQNRVFAWELFEIINDGSKEITLCFVDGVEDYEV
jgi:hypothetical protein